ncbi:MAG: DEAD/DEAH box helicase family protein, partial [Succinivibrionaceae bacterium]
MSEFSEDSRVKFPTIKHLMEMGYEYISFKGVSTKDGVLEKTDVDPLTNILPSYLKKSFLKLNPTKHEGDFEKLLTKIQNSLNNDDLGKQFYNDFLLNPDERIIDLSGPENFRVNNTFQVTTELTCGDKNSDNYRPDITLFINGLPLAFIEVKKENNTKGIQAETDRMKIRFKTLAFRRFLNITQIMVFSNDMEYALENRPPIQGAYYATIGRRDTKYSTFREENQDSFPIKQHINPVPRVLEELMLKDNNVPQYINYSEYKTNCNFSNSPTKRMCNSLFSFERFHFLLKYGIAYADYSFGKQKHIIRYPQLFATKSIERMLDRGEQKGVIWHTQGSGKTALTYYNVKYLTDYYSKKGIIPQFFFIVDRLDLMVQAQMEFSCRGLKVNPVQDKEDFKNIITSSLTTQNQEGKLEITVVNIQKFTDDSRAISKSAYNLQVKRIYFIDEAHRNYDPKGSFLKNLFASDENAIKIALTGTPIITRDMNTKDIFGRYIHTYYYNASISDGYTLRLLRENIKSNFKGQMQDTIKQLKVDPRYVKIKDIYSHKNYVEPLLDYVINDLKDYRTSENDSSLAGMVVCSSKQQAEMMYKIFLDKYADPNELHKEVDDGIQIIESVSPEVISGAKDWVAKKGYYRAALILCDSDGKETRKAWIDLFKEGRIDLLIVFQMLQTGFDAPRLKKLYLNRMVKAHNLLQTLTRVNRPYKDLKYGCVVDFADIEQEYSKTNGTYQKELEEEQGKDAVSTIDRLFVSEDEAREQIISAVEILEPFELQNPTIFSKQVNLVDDVKRLHEIRKSLVVLQGIHNMLMSQGSDVEKIRDEFEDRCNFSEMYNFIKATKNRIISINYLNHDSDVENVKGLLNTALEDLTFNFEKVGEEVLELAEQYKEAVAYVRNNLLNNIDPDDPEYKTLEQAFLEEVTKKGIIDGNDQNSMTVFNMHDRVNAINNILDRIRKKNEEDNIIAMKYKGDKKFVRIEKRLKEKSHEAEQKNTENSPYLVFTKNQNKVNKVLLNIKEEVDEVCLKNEEVINVAGYFNKQVKSSVTRQFRAAFGATDSDLRNFVTGIIGKEYKLTTNRV